MSKSQKKLYKVPLIGFILLIIIGAVTLMLPICNNKEISFIDSLFISTSGICITGYTPLVLSEQFTWFGQLILLILVEIGALGFMTYIVFFSAITKRKLNISEVMLLEDGEINVGFKEKTKNIIKYTFTIELIGATLISFRFIPIYGFKKGVWYSLFHAVTAFCNSGFDIIGESSFEPFTNDIAVNIVIIILIILGGIGFLVLNDLKKVIKNRTIKKLEFQSKIVLITTAVLLISSITIIKIMEPNLTLLQAMFTAVTLRTAGFSTINMAQCSEATKMIGVILMFIGGAPGSTSGGIRVVTLAVLVLSTISTLRNRKEVIVFSKRINQNTIMKAITIAVWSLLAVFVGIIIMTFFNNIGLKNIIFHCVGAFSDTGLGLVPTSLLNNIGKITIIILMFIGRVGPIVAFRVFFDTGREEKNIKYVDGDLIL